MPSTSVACGCVSSYGHAHSLDAAIHAIHWHGSILHWALAVTAGKPGVFTFSPSMSSTKAHACSNPNTDLYTYQKNRAWEASVEWARRKACRDFRLFAIIQWPLTVIANGQRSSIFALTICTILYRYLHKYITNFMPHSANVGNSSQLLVCNFL